MPTLCEKHPRKTYKSQGCMNLTWSTPPNRMNLQRFVAAIQWEMCANKTHDKKGLNSCPSKQANKTTVLRPQNLQHFSFLNQSDIPKIRVCPRTKHTCFYEVRQNDSCAKIIQHWQGLVFFHCYCCNAQKNALFEAYCRTNTSFKCQISYACIFSQSLTCHYMKLL